jgi:hypothetical protein
MFFRTLIVLAIAAAALPAAGCGGGGDDGAGAANGSTATDGADRATGAKGEFVEAANAACFQRRKQMRQEFNALARNASETPSAVESLIERVIAPGLEAEVREIRALEPPPAETRQIEAILAAIQETVDQAQADPVEFTKHGPFSEVTKLANEYGLTACGRL